MEWWWLRIEAVDDLIGDKVVHCSDFEKEVCVITACELYTLPMWKFLLYNFIKDMTQEGNLSIVRFVQERKITTRVTSSFFSKYTYNTSVPEGQQTLLKLNLSRSVKEKVNQAYTRLIFARINPNPMC